jgi:hypothetical protein
MSTPAISARIVAGMATMPTRAHVFPEAFRSIVRQVDRLYLYLDRIEEVPQAARGDARVVPILSRDEPGLGCDGKFLALVREREPFVFVGADDDIVYPPDYAARLRAELEAVASPCVVGVHGARLKHPHASYHADRTVFHWAKGYDSREPVHVLGTGTLMFDTRHLCFDPRQWRPVNVTDLQVALEAARRNLPMYAIARPAGFLRGLGEAQEDSLYLAMRRDDRLHTQLAREILALRTAAATLDAGAADSV